MTTLAAVLVRQRSAPLETVEQAMLRQSLFGGDLATNLLELQCIDEQTLLSAQAVALGCPPLTCGRIDTVSESLRGLIPASVLFEHQCLLLRIEGGTAEVAISAPLPDAVVQDLSTRLSVPVSFRSALEVRIQQALAVFFGGLLNARTTKLLARLDNIAYESLPPTSLPPEEGSEVFAARKVSEPSSERPTPRVSLSAAAHGANSPRTAEASVRASKSLNPLGVRPRRLGPFTAAMAESELSQATTPGEVIEVWVDFASQYFDYTAVFAIQGDLAAGKLARGNGTTGEPFCRIGVPLDLPSALDRARRSANFLLTALEPRGLDRNLARDLGRSAGPQVLLLPISVRNRVVLVTYGDHGNENVALDRVGDLLALRPLVERHLERLLVERKRERSLAPPAARPSHSPTVSNFATAGSPEVQSAENASPAQVSGDRRGVPNPWAQPTPPVAGHAPPNALSPSPPDEEPRPTVIESAAPTRPNLTSDLPTSPALQPVQPFHSATPPSDPPTTFDPAAVDLAVAQSHDWHGSAAAPAPELDESWDLIQPVVSIGDAGLPRDLRAPVQVQASVRPPSSPPGSVWPTSSTRPGIAPRLELVADTDTEQNALERASSAQPVGDARQTDTPNRLEELAPKTDLSSELPAFRAESHPAIVPLRPSQSQEMALPTVLVDYDSDCMELIRRWTRGDVSALEQLVDLGDAAIGVLVREMPGPTTTPSRAHRGDPVVKASECGPILQALAAFGPAARPYVIARAADGDPKVRAWSVRLLGELGGRPSAAAVAQRVVLDKDAEVRRAAHLSCQLLYRDPDSAQSLRQALLDYAFDRNAVITHRLAAIDALSDLRDTHAIAGLFELLSDPNPGAAAGAQQALVVLTRQDFGYDMKNWQTWWEANSGRERIEWVIDALEHRQVAIRQAASEELRLMSRIYIGSDDDDTFEARARVQKKYRDWWASGGRQNSLTPKG